MFGGEGGKRDRRIWSESGGQGNEYRGKGGRRGAEVKLMTEYGKVETFRRCGRGKEGEGKIRRRDDAGVGNWAAKIVEVETVSRRDRGEEGEG